MGIQVLNNLLVATKRKSGGYVLKCILMMLQLVIEHVKSTRLDVHTAIETFPRLELTEGKSEEEGIMWL